MNSTDQIAAEAERQLWLGDAEPEALHHHNRQVIKAAIGKAIEQIAQRRVSNEFKPDPTSCVPEADQIELEEHCTARSITAETVGHLLRETNIFPNQVERAKDIIEAAIEKATVHLKQNLKDIAQITNGIRKECDELFRAAHASADAEAQDIRNTETPYPIIARASETT